MDANNKGAGLAPPRRPPPQQQTRVFRRQWATYDAPLDAVRRVPLAPPTFRVLSFNTLAGASWCA